MDYDSFSALEHAPACGGAGGSTLTAENGTAIADIEDAARTAPATHTWRDLSVPTAEVEPIKAFLRDLIAGLVAKEPQKELVKRLQRAHKRVIKPSHFTQIYLEEQEAGRLPYCKELEELLITARCRGISGVTVVTIFLSAYPDGQQFSCKWNCHYCPNEPGQPRSYVFKEPGVLRANQCGFDCAEQMWTRINTYRVNGHPTDKFEVLILGGTIHSYPKSYLENYMRDMYYAANTCGTPAATRRAKLNLFEEKEINTASEHRIIGVTVETRPDCINPVELRDFRRWGVTRVQLGVQHTDDAILKRVNRGHGLKHTEAAIKLLKDNCFKVDIHLMPNLPGATPDADKAMFDYTLDRLHPDQVKIYPCTTMPFTQILEDYKAGKYVPYSNEELTDVVLYWKDRVHPWIRNNRIVRDIPDSYIVAGVKTSNQRLEFQTIHKARGGVCRCIRCREAGRHPGADPAAGKLTTRVFEAQGGREIFLSWESADESVLFGFLRLRLPAPGTTPVFAELAETALIRELHVYGRTFAVGTHATSASVGNVGVAQHLGIGRRLMAAAERIARTNGFARIAVISGVGVRRYYESLGYTLQEDGLGEFMIKLLPFVDCFAPLYVLALFVLAIAMFIAVCLTNKSFTRLR
jgi:ELP3 family radical SAM enzyme/protein acetyltransferase